MIYLLIISVILVVIGLILFIIDAFFIVDKKKELIKRKLNNFCILIPARDESNVISNILDSIKNQSIKVDLSNVYIIVEDKKDKTIDICREYKANCFIRKKLNLQSKGYALMEVIEDLYEKNKVYDMYFIFDADNVLDEHYLEEMIKCYEMGYDVATGYRKSSNINISALTSSSALTFSLINDLLNENKVAKNRSITISGTGYYISGDIINEFKSFPFHLMTEDYEFSMYLAMRNYKTVYNKKAIFYDEQPNNFKLSLKQRTRWCYGYLSVRRKYKKELRKHLSSRTAFGEYIGIKPYVCMLISVIFYYLYLVVGLFKETNKYLLFILLSTIIIYLLLIIFTIVLLIIDKDLNIKRSIKIKTIFYHPIYLLSFLPCMIRALFGKVNWEKIDHVGLNN